MKTKALEDIKYGPLVIAALVPGKLYFVEDIRRASGLDDKKLRQVLASLLKHKHIDKNQRGQWFLLEQTE